MTSGIMTCKSLTYKFEMMRKISFNIVIIAFLLEISLGINAQSVFNHTRGLIQKNEIEGLRQKVQREPFRSMLISLRDYTEEFCQKEGMTVSDSAALARLHSYLFVLSGEQADADLAWKYTKGVLNNRDIFNNPVSRGLTRATLLRDMAETYDLCFDAWSEKQCREASEKLIYATMTTASNMGYDANYSIESNWMGVRYGAVFLASLVTDDWNTNEQVRSRLLPFEWDSRKRLEDHMAVNINPNGWNTESLSYFSYNWSFVAPALIAMQNNFGPSKFSIEKNVPNAVNALWGYSTATVSIPIAKGKIMQPDFSDDDPMSSYFVIPIGLRLFPENQKPALLWMLNYLSGPDTWETDGEQLFYNIVWTPENMKPINPENLGWLTYFDPDQGLALFRNQFKDENDIVAGFTATAKRVRGHQGYDNLGFRILGLGSIWAVGAGRTDEVAGQTCLFPTADISSQSGTRGALGTVLQSRFGADGSGMIIASGSCMGVVNHERTFQVDYSKKTGAEAVFIVTDHSDNGKIWRINSPDFNSFKVNDNGFTLVAPTGSELKAVVFTDAPNLKITSSKVRYGGETKRLNLGIAYRGQSYEYTNAIDCNTNGNITVVLTLQPKGVKHPVVEINESGRIRVGKEVY